MEKYLYNVDYFEGLYSIKSFGEIKDLDLAEKNKHIKKYCYKESWVGTLSNELKNGVGGILTFCSFTLKTVYPGLLIGTGNAHDIAADHGIKTGFSFDQVTGLPVIPGSTIKGVLRSVFPEDQKNDKQALKEFISELLKDIRAEDADHNIVGKLAGAIFETGQDVFLGAFPVVTGQTPILDLDYITPHKEVTKNPNPISILKVKPDVKYNFMFLLTDSILEDCGGWKLSAGKKAELFKKIITYIGAGAKTNVGFGQFADIEQGRLS